MKSARLAVLFPLLLTAPAAWAQTSIPLTISGNEAKGLIELPGGIGAELSLTFEDVVGLNPGALNVSAQLVNPLDLGLLARLPAIGVSVPLAFPVLLRIEPSPESALTFAGVYAISLHTHNLHLDARVPLSLFKAPPGEDFEDITTFVGMGSYRAGGSGGGFSEFLILVDTRAIDAVIVGKFADVEETLADNAGVISPAALADLQARLTQARTFYNLGLTVAAIAEMGGFSEKVQAYSGTAIPDVWRAHDPRVNVAGYLRSEADTLKFSLTVKASRDR